MQCRLTKNLSISRASLLVPCLVDRYQALFHLARYPEQYVSPPPSFLRGVISRIPKHKNCNAYKIEIYLVAFVCCRNCSGLGVSGPAYGYGEVECNLYRRWKPRFANRVSQMGFIVGTVTAQGLNKGHAGFPEFHNVYIEEWAYEAFRKNGEFPEGTVICKELILVLKPTHPDGSQDEASGRGYFQGKYNGLDVTVKDSKRFAKTGNWGFFNLVAARYGKSKPPSKKPSPPSRLQGAKPSPFRPTSKTSLPLNCFSPSLTPN